MANEFLTKKVVKIPFAYNGTDSQGAANSTVATHGTGVFIPANAVVTNAFYNVRTTFTSAADSATLALSIASAGDLVAAIAIDDASNVWDSGVHGTLLTAPNLGNDAAHDTALETIALFAALPLVMSAVKEVTVAVAVQALTAGEMDLYIEYVS